MMEGLYSKALQDDHSRAVQEALAAWDNSNISMDQLDVLIWHWTSLLIEMRANANLFGEIVINDIHLRYLAVEQMIVDRGKAKLQAIVQRRNGGDGRAG